MPPLPDTEEVGFPGKLAPLAALARRLVDRQRRLGFTILELLVSMTILVLLVAILAGIFSSVSKTSQLGYSNNERMQNILAITDFIRTDLRSALLPVNRTDTNSLQFVVNPGSVGASFKNPHSVFWQAPIATDQTLGDVAEVGYFVKWNTDNVSNPKPYLCRFSVANSASGTNFLIYSSPTTWLTDSILNAVAPADVANAYQGLIAENVVALFVQCLDAKGQLITRNAAGVTFNNSLFDSRQGFIDSAVPPNTNAACALPPVVRLGFVLIDSRSVNRIGPAQKATLTGLSATATDAADYVTKALARTDLSGIAEGLRSHQIEVNIFNAR